jgi:hypothetical protein
MARFDSMLYILDPSRPLARSLLSTRTWRKGSSLRAGDITGDALGGPSQGSTDHPGNNVHLVTS